MQSALRRQIKIDTISETAWNQTGLQMYEPPHWLNIMMKDLHVSTVQEPARFPKLRASGLPYCPIMHLKEIRSWYENNKEKEGECEPYSKMFYTSTGTNLHLLLQKFFARTYPDEVYGDWECSRVLHKKVLDNKTINATCSHVVRNSTFSDVRVKCPHGHAGCKNNLTYKELEIEDGPFSGHIDLLLKYKNKFVPLDFKTTSEFLFEEPEKAVSMGYYPSKKYIDQIESYAFYLKNRFKLDVPGYGIVYVSRNDPSSKSKKFRIFWFDLTNDRLRFRGQQLALQKKAANAVISLNEKPSSSNIHTVVDTKPCANDRDYKNKMAHSFFKDQCPFYADGSCFKNPVRLVNGLVRDIHDFKSPKHIKAEPGKNRVPVLQGKR